MFLKLVSIVWKYFDLSYIKTDKFPFFSVETPRILFINIYIFIGKNWKQERININ